MTNSRKMCLRGWRLSLTPSISLVSGACLEARRGAFNKFEAVDFAGRSRNVSNAFNPLELNLFDDPTGGLAAGPAEELSTTEIEHQVRLYVSAYSRSLFYLLYTPFVDVISVLLERGLVPDTARAGEVMCRWFTDGALTLQNPTCVEAAMGPAAWRELCAGLDDFYADVAAVLPLPAAAQRHGLAAELLVPFMRQLAMELLVPARRRAVVAVLPGLVLGLANGRAPPALGLHPTDQRARAVATADLFLSAGQETGNTDLAYLGIQLLRANDIPVPFPKQKQLTNVFAAATRIQTDWQMRVSGQLVEVLPKWMEYYKKVHNDNVNAMKRLHEKDSAEATVAVGEKFSDKNETKKLASKNNPEKTNTTTTTTTTTSRDTISKSNRNSQDDEGVHDYFTSHRAENLVRLSDLENRILQCVRNRETAWSDENNKLYSRFRRKRSGNVGELKKERAGEEEEVEVELEEDNDDNDIVERVNAENVGGKRHSRKKAEGQKSKGDSNNRDWDDDDGDENNSKSNGLHLGKTKKTNTSLEFEEISPEPASRSNKVSKRSEQPKNTKRGGKKEIEEKKKNPKQKGGKRKGNTNTKACENDEMDEIPYKENMVFGV
ncbi:uncharacterized protein TM35_000102190 [Trypanosoma theileri]|uniref:Uncharacterized protein n=1 Tax=Trypanosoma theileri TaxID=67003 RepID=A0A1X0NZC8_9TRYP|nr:uncharacterized protein TM35_000102190 [Trypanosoma theileri]ORC89951.1 hypothetical protein TM35_000102190 [Trypanosoma theileri]